MQKGQIQQVVDTLPDEVDVDALIERLYLLRRLEEAERNLRPARCSNTRRFERRMAQWLK